MAVIFLLFFPETARRELEDINPEDDIAGRDDRRGRAAADGAAPPPPSAADAPAPVSGDPDEVGSAAPG
jgi:hypothetical protein